MGKNADLHPAGIRSYMKCEPGRLRLFIAVELDNKVKKKLEETIDNLRRTRARVKWVDSSRMHLTLVFLGNTPEGKLDLVKASIDRSVSSEAAFACKVKGLGFFGSPRSPRVVWAGLSEQVDSLRRIRSSIESELTKAGIDFDRKDFKPHLTLGRVKSSKGARELAAQIEKMESLELGILKVDSLVLFESRQGTEGVVHLARHQAALPR